MSAANDVTLWPLWKSFPWQMRIPRWAEVRLLKVDEEMLKEGFKPGWQVVLLAQLSESNCFHVDWHLDSLEEAKSPLFWERFLAPSLTNLGGSIFEHYHPGEYMGMVRRQAESELKNGIKYPEQDYGLWVDRIALSV